MPELPDVENYKRYLDETALHQKIEDVAVGSPKILRGLSGPRLREALRGRQMQRSRRYGKHLLVALDDGTWLTLHFGMTGRLAYFKGLADDPRHDRLRFDFANGYHLAYLDQRMLGEVGLAENADAISARAASRPPKARRGGERIRSAGVSSQTPVFMTQYRNWRLQ